MCLFAILFGLLMNLQSSRGSARVLFTRRDAVIYLLLALAFGGAALLVNALPGIYELCKTALSQFKWFPFWELPPL